MYSDLQAAVNLGGHLTDWFKIGGGVRQGDNLAPTLFTIFINSLTQEINQLDEGVRLENGTKVAILLFADDIVLLSETEIGLQRQLNTLNEWVKRNRMSVNMEKTKVIHFRSNNSKQTDTKFQLGSETVIVTSNYKYLGITVNEFLDMSYSTKILATSASRALGSLTAKYFNAKGLLYQTFTKLFNATVLPILHYAAPIWGNKKYHHQEVIQQRAMRTFMGVGKKTPIPGLYGEMGWHPLSFYRKKDTIRYWLKLYNMDYNRLPKQIFLSDYIPALQGKKSWSKDIKDTLTELNMRDTFFIFKTSAHVNCFQFQ